MLTRILTAFAAGLALLLVQLQPAPAGYAGPRRALLAQGLCAPVETGKLVGSMATKPSPARVKIDDRLICDMKACGTWQLRDVLYVTAAHASDAWQKNWKNPGTLDLTVAAGAVTFTTDRGINGDGTTTIVSTGYNPASASLGIATASAHGLMFAMNAGTVGANNTDIQADNGRLKVRGTLQSGIALNVATLSAATTGAGARPLLAGGHRRDSSNQLPFTNGVQDGSAAAAAGALPSSITLLGNATQALFTNRQGALYSVGQAFTDAQAICDYNAILKHMRAIGAAN